MWKIIVVDQQYTIEWNWSFWMGTNPDLWFCFFFFRTQTSSILFCFYSRTLLELIFCSVCGVSDMQHAPCRSVILWWWFRGQLYSLLLEPELLIPFSWSIPATWSCLPFLWAEWFFLLGQFPPVGSRVSQGMRAGETWDQGWVGGGWRSTVPFPLQWTIPLA